MGYFCDKCKNYILTNTSHNCKKYTVSIYHSDKEYYGEMSAYAISIKQALEQIAEMYNDEGSLVNDFIIAIHEGKSYTLSAELDITYRVKDN